MSSYYITREFELFPLHVDYEISLESLYFTHEKWLWTQCALCLPLTLHIRTNFSALHQCHFSSPTHFTNTQAFFSPLTSEVLGSLWQPPNKISPFFLSVFYELEINLELTMKNSMNYKMGLDEMINFNY